MVFDSLAPGYDSQFTDTAIGQILRGRVHARLGRHFASGDQVLELGCGTGEDALHLAERGIKVTATDSSEAMLAVARAKTDANPLVTIAQFDIRTTHTSSLPDMTYDGAFANFGPLNLLDDRRPLAAWLAERIRPGGILGLGVMGPLCLWEIGWHTLHGDFRSAFRRLKGRADFQGTAIYYPSPARLSQDFVPWFRPVHLEPLGLWLPPSEMFSVVEKRPRLLRWLTRLEMHSAPFSALAGLADHYWIEFERCPAEP